MSHPMIHNCPVCEKTLLATRLECSNCHTVIENNFTLSKFATLSKEQIEFIEVFIVSRGNIKTVEKRLGISYPTVRGRLNEIVTLLGHDEPPREPDHDPSEVIQRLENDEITAEEAISLLKNRGGD